MARPRKKPKLSYAAELIRETLPWSCTHFGGASEIEAFTRATGRWETIADVHSVGSADAEDIAAFIVHCANEASKTRALFRKLVPLLEACIDNKVLAGQAADELRLVLGKIRESL